MKQQILLSASLLAVWLLAASLSSADSVSLPLELDSNGHLRVPVTMENGESYDFILDTGASQTGITQPLVQALNLQADPDESAVLNGTTGASQIKMYPPMQLRIGGVLNYQSLLLPAMGELEIPGEPFYGILGSDFFEQYVVEIDARGGRLRLSGDNLLSQKEQEKFAALPIRSHENGIWVLDVEVSGVQLTALLDTGARSSILNPAAAAALGVTLPASFSEGSEKISGATGHGARGIALQVDSVIAGGRAWLSPQITVADIHIFGMLGLKDEPAMILASDLLFDGRLVVDYGKRMVYLEIPESLASNAGTIIH